MNKKEGFNVGSQENSQNTNNTSNIDTSINISNIENSTGVSSEDLVEEITEERGFYLNDIMDDINYCNSHTECESNRCLNNLIQIDADGTMFVGNENIVTNEEDIKDGVCVSVEKVEALSNDTTDNQNLAIELLEHIQDAKRLFVNLMDIASEFLILHPEQHVIDPVVIQEQKIILNDSDILLLTDYSLSTISSLFSIYSNIIDVIEEQISVNLLLYIRDKIVLIEEIIENIPDQDIKEYFMTKFNQVLEMFNSPENQEIIQDGMSQIQEAAEEFNPFQDLTLTEILIKVVNIKTIILDTIIEMKNTLDIETIINDMTGLTAEKQDELRFLFTQLQEAEVNVEELLSELSDVEGIGETVTDIRSALEYIKGTYELISFFNPFTDEEVVITNQQAAASGGIGITGMLIRRSLTRKISKQENRVKEEREEFDQERNLEYAKKKIELDRRKSYIMKKLEEDTQIKLDEAEGNPGKVAQIQLEYNKAKEETEEKFTTLDKELMNSVIERDVSRKVKKWREQQKALSIGGLFKSIVDSDTRRDFKKALFMRDQKHSISNPFLVSGWSTSRAIDSGAFGLEMKGQVTEKRDQYGRLVGADLSVGEEGRKKRADMEADIEAEYKKIKNKANNNASELDEKKSINKDKAKEDYIKFRDEYKQSVFDRIIGRDKLEDERDKLKLKLGDRQQYEDFLKQQELLEEFDEIDDELEYEEKKLNDLKKASFLLSESSKKEKIQKQENIVKELQEEFIKKEEELREHETRLSRKARDKVALNSGELSNEALTEFAKRELEIEFEKAILERDSIFKTNNNTSSLQKLLKKKIDKTKVGIGDKDKYLMNNPLITDEKIEIKKRELLRNFANEENNNVSDNTDYKSNSGYKRGKDDEEDELLTKMDSALTRLRTGGSISRGAESYDKLRENRKIERGTLFKARDIADRVRSIKSSERGRRRKRGKGRSKKQYKSRGGGADFSLGLMSAQAAGYK